MIQKHITLGRRAVQAAALFALFAGTLAGCKTFASLQERFFYERRTVVNPLLESPTWLPSLRIVRPAAGMHDGLDKCKYSGGTIDPRYDYWLIEWPDVIYFEKVLRDGKPTEIETRGHEICLTKVTHASTLRLDEEPDDAFTRIWEIDFESDTGRTGPIHVKRHNAKLMNVCLWKGKKVALWRYDDRICMPNRSTVTGKTRSFKFRQRKAGQMIPVHGWDFVSIAEKHKADPRPGGSLKGIDSAGQQRQKKRAPAKNPADTSEAKVNAAEKPKTAKPATEKKQPAAAPKKDAGK